MSKPGTVWWSAIVGLSLWLSACNASSPPAPGPTPASPTLPAATQAGPISVPATSPPVTAGATLAPTPGANATPVPSSQSTAASPVGNPENGAKLFASLPCQSCHDITHPFPGGQVCPNLGNIAAEAERIVHSSDYHGKATTAAGYIRESILDPDAYLVPGDLYHTAEGHSVMPANFGAILTPSQIDDLVAFLMTKR